MGLVVQHNITAMNANRQLGIISGAQAKATEKLSSGYQINRAGDDAAGLTISEKMRSQINGLNKASKNAQDGISLIQSAEGALNEAHSILQRMNELAVQGANDTNQSIDRDAINQELEALTEELDRISNTTQFNKQNLLDGTFTDKNLHVGANANQNIKISINAMNASALGLGKATASVRLTEGTAAVCGTPGQLAGCTGGRYKYGQYSAAGIGSIASYAAGLLAAKSGVASGQVVQKGSTNGKTYYATKNGTTWTSNFATKAGSAKICYQNMMKAAISGDYKKFGVTKGGSNWNQVGSVVSTPAVNSTWGTQQVAGARVDDYATANATITKVQNAINIVSKQRSALGALQNRLEHTVANLDTVSENTAAAESRIRDTDMATQMVEYSKNNILAQAGQSMLAQANQSTQGVLSLLG